MSSGSDETRLVTCWAFLAPARSSAVSLLLMTLAIKNTSSDEPMNVMPPTDKLGSNSGRRTIAGSSSNRTMNTAVTANSQT